MSRNYRARKRTQRHGLIRDDDWLWLFERMIMEGTILTTVRDGHVLGIFETPNKAMDYLNKELDHGIREYEFFYPRIPDKQGQYTSPKPLPSTITLAYWAADGGNYKAEYRLTEIPDQALKGE